MWDTGDSVRDFWDTVWDSWVSRLDNAAREAEMPPSEKSIGCGRPRVGKVTSGQEMRKVSFAHEANLKNWYTI